MSEPSIGNGNDGKNGSNEDHNSHSSHKSHQPTPPIPNRIIQPRGDYLRVRDKTIWDKDSKEAMYVRDLGRRTPQNYEIYRNFIESRSDEVIAYIAICLIHQTNYLLDQQLKTLEKEFIQQGGLRERMTQARLKHRNQRPNQ